MKNFTVKYADMASSMLAAEVLSASVSSEAGVDKALKNALHSCANDPDFAIICDFLQKFAKDLGLDLPNFKLLLQWLTKTDEVSPQLRDMQIKLLRKTRKTVHEKSWESALSKFCFTYSAQDGWEIERFGYKNSSVKIKLRILRELLECQFERNTKFRAKILTLSADSLRSKPIGRDGQGHAYWVTQDNDCNIRIYQEHLDEEIWQVVATNRDEFLNLIKRLRGCEVVQPCRDIGIVDEDTTSSSSNIDSDSAQKASPPEERDDSQEDEQKVPKLSIKIIHGKGSKESTNEKSIGKGEEELAADEDAKLLKKSTSCSEAIESDEEEFEEIEEEYDDESGSEIESEDEINDKNNFLIKNDLDQKFQKNLKSKDENKKVKPLLISQNKILNNENCSPSNASKKRSLDQIDLSSPHRSENQQNNAVKRSRPSLIDSKRSKTANKYEDKEMGEEGCDESTEDVDLEEEVEEEDIDSVAAEEDENEEKLFDDYDDDEDEEVGGEISDPIMHVTGEGSGKDCDVENNLYCINFGLDHDDIQTFSDIIVEDVYYIYGEGSGKDCLVGSNENNENKVNTSEKGISEVSKTPVENETEPQSEISLPQKENKISSILENVDCLKLKETISNIESSNETKNSIEDLDVKKKIYDANSDKKSDKDEKVMNLNEDIKLPKINGEKKSEQITEFHKEKQSDGNDAAENLHLVTDSKILRQEKFSEVPGKEDGQTPINNLSISNADSDGIDVLNQQTHASKMSALESLKKELRESKKKLLEKKLPLTSESTNMKNSSPTVYNRKRRLTDQQQPASVRLPNSESELDLNSENTEDLANDKEMEIDESEKFVGGKRLKMRLKQANTELRKKIEAQKVAAIDETTSSSGGEEELKRRKSILSKQSPNLLLIKSDKNLPNFETRKDGVAKGGDNCTEIDEKPKLTILTSQPPSLKKTIEISPIKVKPTLAEIIENKLKKTTEKVQNDNDGKIKEMALTKKRAITKPLKKNLLTQIRQVESGEDVVPRKRTNSQELNSPIKDVKSFETASKSLAEDVIISKTDIKKQKITLERQRKRRSSEETLQNESLEEPEAKKEVTAFKKNITIKSEKKTDIEKEDLKDFEIQIESSTIVSGRRSGRRGGVVPTYVDSLQPKRNRGSIKKEFSDCEKGLPINEQSPNFEKKVCSTNKKQASEEKSNADSLPREKSNSLTKENPRKEGNTKNNTNLMEMMDDSNAKSSLTTKTPLKGVRKQREVDASNIIDIDSETPVRQSRRIAQQKIREEAERRKLEEIALRTMKQELKKKKKAEKQADPTVVPPSEPSSESEESDVEVKRKVLKKKCPGKNGNWSSGSEEQEEPEEEDEEPPHYESDPGSPLFKSDHEFSPESDIEDESQAVPMKRARTVRKEDVDGDAIAPDEEEACQKCNKSDHPEWILLCDTCDKGYHCSCLSPVLFYIPEGDWYCPPCQQEQLIKALENQLKEFDDLVENKKKEEELEKRMAEEEKVRQEREEETNKHKKDKKDKKINDKRDNGNSSADHSQDDDEKIINSDDSKESESNKQSGRYKNKNRFRKSKKSDKRNNRDRRHNRTRGQRNRLQKHAFDSDSDSQESSNSNSGSKSDSSSSSTYSESDNEPIYKLRKRRQINVSYRLNEYDDLINSALRKEMDEVAGAGNLGRGKDISTIIEADKEEKARQKQIEDGEVVIKPKEEQKDDDSVKETNQSSLKVELNERKTVIEEDDSDAEPIIRKVGTKTSQKKKSRKLTTLDISSEDDDGSDEDFKGSSLDDEEEDSSISASNSDSSLEIYKRHGKLKKKRRKVTRRGFRERRRKDRFLADESDDEEVQRPKSKKKRKDVSDYTESEADDDDMSELSENIDSADLCDDTTTDESDGAWKPNKSKKAKKSTTSLPQKSPKTKSIHIKKHKKAEYSDDDVSESEEDEDEDDNEEIGSGKGMGKQPRSQPLKVNSNSTKTKGKGKEKPPAKTKKKISSEDESSKSDSEDSTRRTRGRRYAYIEDFDDDSSDGGIKPGVQRPDTPPEEREKFIKRQEEIKRMLAEKNAEGAKLAATPRLTPIKTDGERDKPSPAKAGGDSLSTVPLSVIRQAKVLDIDYLQRRGESLDDLSNEVGEVDDFDDADLPDDLPEDMDEDAIARMVEEEEEFGVTAIRELPAPDEVLRTTTTIKNSKTKEVEKTPLSGSTSSLSINTTQVTTVTVPTPTSGLQEPVRKRLPMPTIHPPLLRHQFLMHDSMPNTHHSMQRHGGPPTSHLLQNALSAPLTHTLDRNYPPSTPTASHNSFINKTTQNISLQSTVSHALSATRPSQALSHSVITKSSTLLNEPGQEKSTNPQIVTENKPRGRRKKITPLRDTLQKQQTAAAVTAATATSSALASSLVKNNNPVSTSFLSSVIKSGSTPKLPSQASVITSMSPTLHSATSRPGVPIPSITGSFVRNDGPRFYDSLGNRISQTSVQRHRGPPQMPPSLLPPHPANRSSYGLPPPLKGSNSGPPVSSSGSIRNPIRHVPPPYLGMPPNARHASHLNMYSRPPIYGNPNFGPRVNLRPPNIHPSDYSPGSRAYPPYGFYPPPPPLTAPGQRAGPISVSRSSIQMPQIQSTLAHPPASVIVSTTSSKSSNIPTAAPQPTPLPKPEVNDPSSSSKLVVVTEGSQIKVSSSKSSSPTPVVAQTGKSVTAPMTVAEPRKKLTTLQAYTANPAKKSPVLPSSDSSSRSPPNPPTEVNDDSSAPGTSEITPTAEQPTREEGQASEFSGLVSYFSSQHDDYNT